MKPALDVTADASKEDSLSRLNSKGAYECDNANLFLDRLIKLGGMRNDAELSRWLEIAPPTISKIRHGRSNVSADFLIRVLMSFELQIQELKSLMSPRQGVRPVLPAPRFTVAGSGRRTAKRRRAGADSAQTPGGK